MFLTGPGGRPLGRENWAEWATNHPLPTHLFETNLRREGAIILFLGLRAGEPEELYDRNPVFEGACGYGMQAEAPQ